jgi:hypothetical protein
MIKSPRARCFTRPDFGRIIDAIMQAHYYRVGPNKFGHFCRDTRRIVRFNAEKNQRAISNGAQVGRRVGPDSFLALQFINDQTFRTNRVSEMFSSDENSRRARAGEHSTKIPAHCASADDCNSRPFSRFAHYFSSGSATCFKS